jgi:exodeoxyribonuclease VII large subunit
VILWPVAVQGERAAGEVAAAIRGFNALAPGGAVPRPDVIIVARGGGSIEDLMAFNEEIVVRAAAESTIPLISAVGHETDTTLIDFASDRRAPTPTAAAEMAVPVRSELLSQVMDFERRTVRSFGRGMTERRAHLQGLMRALPRADQLFAQPRQRFDLASERLGHALRRNLQVHRRAFTEAATLLRLKTIASKISRGAEQSDALLRRLERVFGTNLQRRRAQLEGLSRVLDGVSYRAALERGFALVRGADAHVRRRAASVQTGEKLTITFADGTVEASVGTTSDPRPKPVRTTKPGQGTLF